MYLSSQTFSSSVNALGAATVSLALVSQRQYAIRRHKARTPNKFTRKVDKFKHKFTRRVDKIKGRFYINIKASEFSVNCIENLKQRCCDSDHKLIPSDKKMIRIPPDSPR